MEHVCSSPSPPVFLAVIEISAHINIQFEWWDFPTYSHFHFCESFQWESQIPKVEKPKGKGGFPSNASTSHLLGSAPFWCGEWYPVIGNFGGSGYNEDRSCLTRKEPSGLPFSFISASSQFIGPQYQPHYQRSGKELEHRSYQSFQHNYSDHKNPHFQNTAVDRSW